MQKQQTIVQHDLLYRLYENGASQVDAGLFLPEATAAPSVTVTPEMLREMEYAAASQRRMEKLFTGFRYIPDAVPDGKSHIPRKHKRHQNPRLTSNYSSYSVHRAKG